MVVNWNGATLLPECLSALTRQSHPAHVVVVDNASADASAAVVAGFPGVEWIPLNENVGFAAANNVGIRRALADGATWIGVVNTDVRVERTWLEHLVRAGDAHSEVGILGGLLLFADDPQRVNSTGLVLDRLGRARDRDFGVRLSELTTADGPVAGVSGGAALFRADALRRTGLFDPAYFAYYEDVDLSLRAAALGIRAWYVSAARAVHGFGKSFGSGSPRQKYLLARNHMRSMATHMPLAWVVALAPVLTLFRATVKAPLELLRGHPALASAHLRAAGAGAIVAAEALGRRLRHRSVVPPGADATSERR